MNCFYHIMVPAVAQCRNCGKFLCRECATRYSDMICEDCAYAMRDQEHRRIVRRNLWTIGTFITVALFAASALYETGTFQYFWQIVIGALEAGFFFAGIPFGWHALRNIRVPDDIIVFNLAFLVIMFSIRVVGSIMIGWLLLLFYMLRSLFYALKRIVTGKRV